jgi:heme exporter protein CcmD
MGHINEAAYYVLPAYAVTFATFAVMAALIVRGLATWSRRVRDEEGRAGDEPSDPA